VKIALKVTSILIAGLTLLAAGGFTLEDRRAHHDNEARGTRIVAAGDIASCDNQGDEATADLIEHINPDAVLTLGDNAYENGTAKDYQDCYDSSWGRFKDKTYPALGNHDYGEDGYEGMSDATYDPSAYFDYFGDRVGRRDEGWYSYDLDDWHFVVLNSNCDAGIGCDPYSKQLEWLSKDLSQTSARCVLAYWHHPLYSSGYHGDDPKMRAAWNVLYGYHADVILNGHDHHYERFPLQDPYGNFDPGNGIRQFTVGTGGKSLRQPTTAKPNSEALSNATYGVLQLTLRQGGYDWEFKPTEAGAFSDSGSDDCH
jgi:hypothetical protein